jgi:hypothetical protein
MSRSTVEKPVSGHTFSCHLTRPLAQLNLIG